MVKSDYPNREIILVNDGSRDRTPEICEHLARQYEDLSVIHQENSGLGFARNAGIDASRGELIAFVDSDDLVPVAAYSSMVASIQKTGSSFVVGGVERFNSTKTWEPWFVEEVHSLTRTRTSGLLFPPVVWNVFAWSKIYNRAKFDNIVGRFPAGLYEDQVMSAKIYTSGEPIDVISDIVYSWRAREDNSSITQNKTSTFDLQERLDVAYQVADIIDSSSNIGLKEYWYRKLLSEDLWWYFRVVESSTLQFWTVLRAGVTDFISRAPASSYWGAAPKRRALISFLLDDDRDAFIARVSRP